jgi:hypothetical protein
MRTRSRITIAALALLFLVPVASAGIDSLWTDDATLLKQLAELIKIEQELQTVSDGVLKTAEATRDLVETYDYIRATVEEVQAYGPAALWKDLRSDLYDLYPGFELLNGSLDGWRRSRSPNPPDTYQMLSAVFGDLTEPLRKKEKQGKLDTRTLRLRQFEGAGALALASEAESATRKFDSDIAHLYDQAAQSRTGEESQVISAKAVLLVAAQNSHIIRLLSRGVRLEGVDSAIDYAHHIKAMNGAKRVSRTVLESGVKLAAPQPFMTFPGLW